MAAALIDDLEVTFGEKNAECLARGESSVLVAFVVFVVLVYYWDEV